MAAIITPGEEFQALDMAAVLAGLDDPDPDNPVAREVARLVTGYTANFRDHARRLGHIPESWLHIKARWPIEAVAMEITTRAIREAMIGGAIPPGGPE